MIYIGVYTAKLVMPWVRSLKEKRALVRPVIEKLKARFPVSVARLDGLNDHDWELVGAVTIHHDAQWVRATLEDVSTFLAANGEYTIEEENLEVQQFSD